MRILHVINYFTDRAGAEFSLREFVLATQGPGFQHGIAVLGVGINEFASVEAAGVQVFEPRTPLASTLAKIRHVRRAIRSFRPDLVHTTLADSNLVGRVAAKLASLPALTSLVNTPYVEEALMDRDVPFLRSKRGFVRLVDGLLGRHATTAFHAITETVAVSAVARLGIDPSAITVVPRGRDREFLGKPSPERRLVARQRLGITDARPVLINVARQEAQKGQGYLLEAMIEIRRQHPDVLLLIVGREGARTSALRRTIADRNLEDSVRMLGLRRDVPDLLCASDVFVFPSLYEGLGGAVLEAMALRVPIVATDVPALQEVLEGDRCALLVPIADPGALARGVCAVLDDPDAASERVKAAAQRFETTYELSVSVEGMRRLYEGLA